MRRRLALSLLSHLLASSCALNPARADLVENPAIVDAPGDDGTLRAEGQPVDEQDWYALLGDENSRRAVAESREAAGTTVGFGAGVIVAGLGLGAATGAVLAFSDRADSDRLTIGLIAGGVSVAVAAAGVSAIVLNLPTASGGRVTSSERAKKAWAAAREPPSSSAVSSSSGPAAPASAASLDDTPFPAWKIPDSFESSPQRCHDGDAFHCHQIGLLSLAGIRTVGEDDAHRLERASRFLHEACERGRKATCPHGDEVDAERAALHPLAGDARQAFICQKALAHAELFETRVTSSVIVENECVPLFPPRMKRVVEAVASLGERDAPLLIAQGALEALCPTLDPKRTLALCRTRNVQTLAEAAALADVATLLHRHTGDLVSEPEMKAVLDHLVHR